MRGFAAEHPGARVRPSPNFGDRRHGLHPDCIILHYTGMESAGAAEDWLCDPRSEVSSHYLVYEDGAITQMVREAERAWHAGRSLWEGRDDLNSRSVGIEIVNPGHAGGSPPYPDVQIDAVIALCRGICRRLDIDPLRVLAHSDVAPGRKADPGETFPWVRLAAAGLGLFVEPQPIAAGNMIGPGDEGDEVRRLQSLLAQLGYGVVPSGVFDELTEACVEAFQRHFRPARVDGIADASTVATLELLVAAKANRRTAVV